MESADDSFHQLFENGELSWTIENVQMSFKKTENGIVTSPCFRINKNGSLWQMFIQVAKRIPEDLDYVSMYVQRIKKVPGVQKSAFEYEIGLYRGDGVHIVTKSTEHSRAIKGGDGYTDFMKYSELENALLQSKDKRNTLRVVCRILAASKISGPRNTHSEMDEDFSLISEDLLNLYKRRECTDMTIQGTGFHHACHKAIMCARSKTIQEGLRGAKASKVVFDCTNPDVLQNIILMSYSGNIDAIDFFKMSLTNFLQLAKKIHLDDLQMITERSFLDARSWMEIQKCGTLWSIERFSVRKKTVTSSYFESHLYPSTRWRLLMTFNDDDFVGIYVRKIDERTDLTPVVVSLTVSLRDTNGKLCHSQSKLQTLNPETKTCGFQSFINVNTINDKQSKLLADDVLSVNVVIEMPASDVKNCLHQTTTNTAILQHYSEPGGIFSENMRTLLLKETYSDAILMAGNRIFRVHSVILSARSRVFYKLFFSAKSEGTIQIKITGVDPAALEELILYAYTGRTRQLCPHLLVQLYVATGVFGMQHLRKKCAAALKFALSMEIVWRVYYVSDHAGDVGLKKSALKYILYHVDKALLAPHWQVILTNHADLATEVLEAVSVFCNRSSEEEEEEEVEEEETSKE